MVVVTDGSTFHAKVQDWRKKPSSPCSKRVCAALPNLNSIVIEKKSISTASQQQWQQNSGMVASPRMRSGITLFFVAYRTRAYERMCTLTRARRITTSRISFATNASLSRTQVPQVRTTPKRTKLRERKGESHKLLASSLASLESQRKLLHARFCNERILQFPLPSFRLGRRF